MLPFFFQVSKFCSGRNCALLHSHPFKNSDFYFLVVESATLTHIVGFPKSVPPPGLCWLPSLVWCAERRHNHHHHHHHHHHHGGPLHTFRTSRTHFVRSFTPHYVITINTYKLEVNFDRKNQIPPPNKTQITLRKFVAGPILHCRGHCTSTYPPNSIQTDSCAFWRNVNPNKRVTSKVFYSPTNAQVIVLKTILKFTLK